MGSEAGHDRANGFVIAGISPNIQTSDYRLGAIPPCDLFPYVPAIGTPFDIGGILVLASRCRWHPVPARHGSPGGRNTLNDSGKEGTMLLTAGLRVLRG